MIGLPYFSILNKFDLILTNILDLAARFLSRKLIKVNVTNRSEPNLDTKIDYGRG